MLAVMAFSLNFLKNLSVSVCLLSLFITSCQCLQYNATALLIGANEAAILEASFMLDGYAINYETLQVPESGASLPILETKNMGNFGLFVLIAQVKYNGTTALTPKQMEALYSYQSKYGVRMIHISATPSAEFGVESLGYCCNNNAEQNMTLLESVAKEQFPTAGLRFTNVSTVGLFHYPAAILGENETSTVAFANFLPNSEFQNATVAGVINLMDNGREQMAFFMETGNWSVASSYMGHVWVQWGYRGLYQGYRRINLGTQIDDLFLQTQIYSSHDLFRLRAEDLEEHIEWMAGLNSRLNPGSTYFTEFGFNANGNLIFDYSAGQNNADLTCATPLFTEWDEPTTLEFKKPLGTGSSRWPGNAVFRWSADCLFLDPLAQFFANISNRDALGLVTHTFTHLELDNATYHDAVREIAFNLMYAELLNFTNAAKFSGSGLIPPAITGLHNGDALRAWSDNGLWNAIGDNTRPELRNEDNHHWPRITTLESNGYDGYQITPRFATRIYYNCDQIHCDVQQWIDTDNETSSSTINDLLTVEIPQVTNQLLGLYHDPYMFHQPNLRQIDVEEVYLNGKMQKLSLLQIWVESITTELVRLVEWPIITLRHDHIAMAFNQRYIQDSCKPFVLHEFNNSKITGVTIGAGTTNMCDVTLPFTVPGPLADTKGFRTEQLGSDPITIWVKLDGEPVSFALAKPIST